MSDFENINSLSHLDEHGAAHMVDVSNKNITHRVARARAILQTTPQVIALITTGGLPKGDALATARVAGIMAAKQTSTLIPLCHPLSLTSVNIDFTVYETTIEIIASVRTTDRTGVEMEALTAASIAGLTLYDMIKAVDRAATIETLSVIYKDGGRTGLWERA